MATIMFSVFFFFFLKRNNQSASDKLECSRWTTMYVILFRKHYCNPIQMDKYIYTIKYNTQFIKIFRPINKYYLFIVR